MAEAIIPELTEVTTSLAKYKKRKRKILRGTAWYRCDNGSCTVDKWKVRHSAGGLKTCEECQKENIQPYDFEPDPWKKGLPKEWRLFGDFRCPTDTCKRNWPSANTWIEWNPGLKKWDQYWQACKKCPEDETNKVYPTHIRPLLHGRDDRHKKKEHLTKYCQKCKKLGKNCRTYAPPLEPANDDEEEEEEDDDVSVMSDVNHMDEVPTPVPSDEETNEEFLSSKLGNLTLSGK